MTSTEINPQNILTAFQHLAAQWPNLIGKANWLEVEETVQEKMQKLAESQDINEQRWLAIELREMVEPYDAARERLWDELHIWANLRDELYPELTTMAQHHGIDDAQTTSSLNHALLAISPELSDSDGATRTIYMDKGGVDGAKLVRLSNIRLSYGNLFELGVGLSAAASEVISDVGLLNAAGILLAVRSLRKLAAIDIGQAEATVFWGLLHACGRPDHPAKEEEIMARINQERRKFKLGKLTEDQIQTALDSLKRLGVIEPVDSSYPMWQFVESCQIKGDM